VATIRSLEAAVTALRGEHDAAITALLYEIATAHAERPAEPVNWLLDAFRRGRAV